MKETMKKIITKKFITLGLLVVFSVALSSCAGMQTNQEQGTAVGVGTGAVIGAILGQAIGGDTEATMLGATLGAAIGGVAGSQVGRYMDNQQRELQNALAASQAASISREQDILRATFRGNAYFDTDSAQLKAGAYPELKRIADILNRYPQTTIEVAGHTDYTGTPEYNQRLSERRARSVANELIRNGVLAQRISVVGYGETRPVSSDKAMNRRVEIVIVPVVEAKG